LIFELALIFVAYLGILTNPNKMAQIRKLMQDIRVLLHYYYGEGYSKRKIARGLGISETTVRKYLRRAEEAQITWPLPESVTDEVLEGLLFPDSGSAPIRPQPDWKAVHERLPGKGITLDLIWRDWKEENPEGYSYGHFCECYRQWCDAQKITARIEHKAGEKLCSLCVGTQGLFGGLSCTVSSSAASYGGTKSCAC